METEQRLDDISRQLEAGLRPSWMTPGMERFLKMRLKRTFLETDGEKEE